MLEEKVKNPNLKAVLLVGMYYSMCVRTCNDELAELLEKHGRDDVKIAVNFMLTMESVGLGSLGACL